jgi:hypothetical protein
MFKSDLDSRLTAWSKLRKNLEVSEYPFQDLIDFWQQAPLSNNNNPIDPFYPASWPTPWEIIEINRYNDFTKAVMMGYTLLLTDRYKDLSIQIKTLVDKEHKRLYNAVYIDDMWVLNFSDFEVVLSDQIPNSCCLENLVELKRPR